MFSKNSKWESRVIRRPGRPHVDWLRIGMLGNPSITLGVLRSGKWVVDTADGLADLEDAKALTFAFPLLNSSIREVHEKLAEYRRIFGNAISVEFPITRLVAHAISNGGYWAEQSLPWLLEIDLDGHEKLIVIDGLRAIENDSEFGQKLRHSAAQYRRQVESLEG